ncbi:DUF3949 domain-containing protein [Bacillus cereus]
MYGMEWKSNVRKDGIIIQFSCILCYDYIVRKWNRERWYTLCRQPYSFFGSIALFYFLVMIPIQYLYLQGLHEKKEKTGLSQRELYEKNVFLEKNNYIFTYKGTHLIYHLRLLRI